MCGGTAAESDCHQGLAGSGDATCTCTMYMYVCGMCERKEGREEGTEGERDIYNMRESC